MTEDKKIKFVRSGGCVNHVVLFFACLFWFPVLVFTVWIFADEIDAVTSRWEFQFIFVMGLLLIIGLPFAFRKILGK